MKPFISATSLPILCLMWMEDKGARSIQRGSQRISFAPLCLTALIILDEISGWFEVVLEPITIKTCASSNSSMELVIAPLPKEAARPATVEECHSRAQWSTLLVLNAALAIFAKI